MVDSERTESVVAQRVSALAGHYQPGRFGAGAPKEPAGVCLQEVRELILHQIAVWPESIRKVGAQVAKSVGSSSAPGPCMATTGNNGSILRIEPLKWWVVGAEAPVLSAEQGATLDLSHSRTHVRITGDDAVSLLNRHLSLDLRQKSFPVDAVASTAFHHCGITLWRSGNGYELFLPRGFALALWEILVESAEQFGVEVR
jgi:heterotetrameric sarcosine oxidase gamma subunit